MTNKRLESIIDLFTDAVGKKVTIDERVKRRNDLYKGTHLVRDKKKGGYAKKAAYCKRNMCFELIEAQINNAIPMPKVTPRDPANKDLSADLEGYLKMEMDRISSEEINDEAERGTLKQGTAFYLVGWDETQTTPTTRGELFVKYYPLNDVFPQPGVKEIEDAEYIFVRDLVSCEKIKAQYNVDIEEDSEYRGMFYMITYYYFNKQGYLSRVAWGEKSETIVFDEEAYELRRIKTCKVCGEPILEEEKCPVCGSDKFGWEATTTEILQEDIIKGDPAIPGSEEVIAKAGTAIPFYTIRQLPFVIRRNISDDTSLYGISDIDLLEENQESMNKILTKMEENVLKAGSFVTKLQGVNIPDNDETLKIVTLKDPNQVKAFTVQTVQANMQQDNILQEEFYQMGRDSLGITDSYQGKRDTTAESGKAKQIAAGQAAGRLESKRRMKDAAYGDLYKLMFKFLLAYCDEKRTYARVTPTGEYIEGSFSRYNYLDGVLGDVYYNDRFLFSVDSASILTTSREAMWAETLNNFQLGTFGNPADPSSLMLYWNTMKGLAYPLANQALASLQQRQTQLPFEMQQAIMQNPQILKAVQAVIQNGGTADGLIPDGGGSNENS